MTLSFIWLATQNQGKTVEVRRRLEPLGIRVKTPQPGFEVVEDGETFEDNAVKKALALSRETGEPALADDSGIAVDALGGAPGILSARYAGVQGPDQDRANRDHLRAALAGVPAAKRTARFVCALAWVMPGQTPMVFRGELDGLVIDDERGSSGFGYDSIFLLPDLGLTTAEISLDQKNALSHRGQALDQFTSHLETVHQR